MIMKINPQNSTRNTLVKKKKLITWKLTTTKNWPSYNISSMEYNPPHPKKKKKKKKTHTRHLEFNDECLKLLLCKIFKKK